MKSWPPGDSGVVMQNIETAELFDRGLDGGLHLVVVGDVRFEESRFSFGIFDQLDALLAHLLVKVNDQDGCARGR
jgi:hypothetical protein